MILTEYLVVHLLTSLFLVYTIYRFMLLFYDRRRTNVWVEIVSYLAYNIVITVLMFYVGIPLVLLLANIGLFIALSLNYQANFKHRIMSSIYIYLILMVIEAVVMLTSGFFVKSVFEKNTFDDSVSLIIIRIFSYMVVLVLGKIKRAKAGNKISVGNWLSVTGIPLISIYLVVVIFRVSNLQPVYIVVAVACVFIVNILVFHLYDNLQLQAEQEMEKELLQQQNKYYENQFQLMKTAENSLRGIQHDWKNHLSSLVSMVDRDDHKGIREYLGQLAKADMGTQQQVDTGNIEIDSILNFKLREAIKEGILFNIKVSVPTRLAIRPFDLTIILGNLIDNAIEAVKMNKEAGSIDLNIRYSKKRLFVEISNLINGKLNYKDGLPETTKQSKQDHGIGLKQVRQTLGKYNGDIEFIEEKGRIKVVSIMYLEQV